MTRSTLGRGHTVMSSAYTAVKVLITTDVMLKTDLPVAANFLAAHLENHNTIW